jgi:hypothetical protein
MNLYVKHTKKNLIPKVIINGYNLYMAFVHETSNKPRRYYDFLNDSGRVEDCESYENGDYICPLGISLYFELNDKLMRKQLKYNLMKKRHEYNNKYNNKGKIHTSNNKIL